VDVTGKTGPIPDSKDSQPIGRFAYLKLASPTIQEFERSISGLAPKSRELYLRAAKRAVAHCLRIAGNSSNEAVLRILGDMKWKEKCERFGRVHRFERFLRTLVHGTHVHMNITGNLHFLKRMQYKPVTAMTAVRDYALLAAWATMGEGRGERKRSGVLDLTLKDVVDDSELSIRGETVPLPYRSMLRRWLKIRLRANRPEQYRILRRSSDWAESPFLFPGSNGQKLSRSAIYNAMRRLRAAADWSSDEETSSSG
jgi:hypothetical protein